MVGESDSKCALIAPLILTVFRNHGARRRTLQLRSEFHLGIYIEKCAVVRRVRRGLAARMSASSTARSHHFRQRKRAGMVRLVVEVDEDQAVRLVGCRWCPQARWIRTSTTRSSRRLGVRSHC